MATNYFSQLVYKNEAQKYIWDMRSFFRNLSPSILINVMLIKKHVFNIRDYVIWCIRGLDYHSWGPPFFETVSPEGFWLMAEGDFCIKGNKSLGVWCSNFFYYIGLNCKGITKARKCITSAKIVRNKYEIFRMQNSNHSPNIAWFEFEKIYFML